MAQPDSSGSEARAREAPQPTWQGALSGATHAHADLSFAADEPLRPPSSTIGGYELLGVLGRGGMGVVHRARQVGLNRVVALKMVLGGAYAGPEFLARFKQEAEAAGNLDHPNIVPVYEVGAQDGIHFFSMKLIEGASLAERLVRFRGDPRRVAEVMETAARAIHCAHQHGILHRDLKPSNILLDEDGQPHIMDFGLAKRVQSHDDLTATGILVGTPRYMAPEQARGERALTVAVDVWGLGAVLYELLTGIPPFKAETELETILEVLQREPRRPRAVEPRIDRDLETICLKCLEKEPQRRYGSAEALANDLGRWRRGDSILARPATTPERVWRWAKRRPVIAGLMACILFLAVGGAGAVSAAWLHALAGWRAAEANEKRAEREQLVAERRRDEAEGHLYLSRIAQADLLRRQNRPAAALRLLDQCAPPAADAPDRRNWEWRYLHGLLNEELLAIPTPHEQSVQSLAFSPDGRRLASGGGSPYSPFPPDRVRLWELWGDAAGKEAAEFKHPGVAHSLTYGSAGRRVVWGAELWPGRDAALYSADLRSGKIDMERPLPQGFYVPAVSGDGRRYAARDRIGQAVVWDVETGSELLVASAADGVAGVALSDDGERLALYAGRKVSWWSVARRQRLVELELPEECRGDPRFSPDGKLLALATRAGGVRVWDEQGASRLHLNAQAGEALDLKFSPDGSRLATAGSDGAVRVWSLAGGAELMRIRAHEGRAHCVAFHPSGQLLASGGGEASGVKLWDLNRGAEQATVTAAIDGAIRVEGLGFAAQGAQTLVLRAKGLLQAADAATGRELRAQMIPVVNQNEAPRSYAAFSADGEQVAIVAQADPRQVHLIDLATGQTLAEFVHPQPVQRVCLSGDGKRLASAAATKIGGGVHRIFVWNAATGQKLTERQTAEFPLSHYCGTVALNRDGSLLAYDDLAPPKATAKPGAAPSFEIKLIDPAIGAVRGLIEGLPTEAQAAAFSPAGDLIAVSCEESVFLFETATGKRRLAAPLSGSLLDTFWSLAFSPDGKRLAGASRSQTMLWDVATGEAVLTLHGAPPRAGDNRWNPQVAWSPDGRRLAASQWNRTVAVWDAGDRGSPAAKAAARAAAEARCQPR